MRQRNQWRIADCGLRIGRKTTVRNEAGTTTMLRVALLGIGFLLVAGLAGVAQGAGAEKLRVCTTTPDLGSLVEAVGGDRVEVTVFAKGPEDPHFIEAKPAFVKALNQADLYVQTGLDLEIGWAPALLRNARNAAVTPGGRGYLDAGTLIAPLEIPTGTVDRSMGDVHAAGNPHYLLDPLNGLRVAEAIRDRLAQLDPEHQSEYQDHYEAFRRRLSVALVGTALADKYDAVKLAALAERGGLYNFLKSRGEDGLLGGWLALTAPIAGARVVTDHNLWTYFARRFGLQVVGYLEPKPGVSPTTRHLAELVGLMKVQGVKVILASPYYDPRHARFLADKTGAAVVEMAHQVDSRPGTGDYLALIDYNVRQVAAAFSGGGESGRGK
jgi:ABC-type Zn uptake system ZnuABC Zn-binding protein ZnuA